MQLYLMQQKINIAIFRIHLLASNILEGEYRFCNPWWIDQSHTMSLLVNGLSSLIQKLCGVS